MKKRQTGRVGAVEAEFFNGLLDLTQKVSRRALPLDRLAEASHVEELSELRIRIMTDDDVREIREQQRRDAAEHATDKHRLLHERTAEDDEVVELTPD